jgi:PKD repeat protein
LHTYEFTGTYTVTLIVSNSSEIDSASTTLEVQPGQELVVNGGFETDAAWQFDSAPELGSYTDAAFHSGQRSVKLGILPPARMEYGYAIVSQMITIPVSSGSATLSFWYWPRREDGSVPLTQNRQFIRVLDSHGTLLESLLEASEDLPGWQSAQFDVSQYAGQTISIQFGVFNDGDALHSKRTAMYVDDVSLFIPAH